MSLKLAMDRKQIAETLEEIGLLLELQGQNPFKTRAYHNGARILRGLDRNLAELIENKELTSLKGIGAALADKISKLATEGRLDYLDEQRKQVPDGLLDWLKIPGLGSKKARAIHVALGISTLGELEYACKENRLRDLDGFGETSQKKILAGIDRVRRHAGRFRQPVVQQEAERLLKIVRAVKGVIRAEVGGSVRRRGETSKDIDIVVSAEDAQLVMDAFATDKGVEDLIGRGPTKCSVHLKSGPSADLRVVSDEEFPFALFYFTGSKDHNIEIRGRAQKAGLKLNEYALLDEKSEQPVPCQDEAAIYRKLGLEYIEPELREAQGEVEAAESDALPQLVTYEDLRGVLHCHSTWSDGSASIREMAEATREMGLEYFGLCDHSQAAAYAGGLDPKRVAEQHEEIDKINQEFDGRFRVLKGIEVDILADGRLDFDDDLLSTFDVVVASVHSAFHLDREAQTERILQALRSPFVDILGHPTGRLLLARDGYPLDLNRIIDFAAEQGIAIEINAHPHRLDLDWRNLKYGLRQGLKTAINPDAHAPEGLADMHYGVGVARKGWCTPDDVLNARSAEELTGYFQENRTRRKG